jgi:hypothetical protein
MVKILNPKKWSELTAEEKANYTDQQAYENATSIPSISKNSSEGEIRSWIANRVNQFTQAGYDVGDLGITGLNLDADLTKLDKGQLDGMLEELLAWKGKE